MFLRPPSKKQRPFKILNKNNIKTKEFKIVEELGGALGNISDLYQSQGMCLRFRYYILGFLSYILQTRIITD